MPASRGCICRRSRHGWPFTKSINCGCVCVLVCHVLWQQQLTFLPRTKMSLTTDPGYSQFITTASSFTVIINILISLTILYALLETTHNATCIYYACSTVANFDTSIRAKIFSNDASLFARHINIIVAQFLCRASFVSSEQAAMSSINLINRSCMNSGIKLPAEANTAKYLAYHNEASLIRFVDVFWSFQLYLKSFHPDLKSIHCLYCRVSTRRIVKTHKTCQFNHKQFTNSSLA